jgi:hypothetical protein
MLDLAAPKVAVPATVLMIVMAIPQARIFAPLIVPIISWAVIKFGLKLSLTNADIISISLLTALLSFPVPVEPSIEIVTKGLLFLFIFSYLRITVPEYY